MALSKLCRSRSNAKCISNSTEDDPVDVIKIDRERRLLEQRLIFEGRELLRIFVLDSFEPHFPFRQNTEASAMLERWFASEEATLSRYAEQVM